MTRAGVHLLILLTAGFLSRPTASADSGASAAQFLRLPVDPVGAAMGDAAGALARDAYAPHWNPAGIARLSSPELGVSYASLPQGIRSQYASYVHPLGRFGAVSAQLNSLSVGEFQGYDANGAKTEEISASDFLAGFSYALPLYERPSSGSWWCAGATVKYLRERLDTVQAGAGALDVGVIGSPGILWKPYGRGLRLGAGGRNLGSRLRFDQESSPLPRVWFGSLAFEHFFGEHQATLAAEYDVGDQEKRTVGIGLEGWIRRVLAVRAGWNSMGSLGNGIRFGMGFRVRQLELDYAWMGQGTLGSAHRIGLTFRFRVERDARRREADLKVEAGIDQYSHGRYAEALMDFNDALEADPAHPEALSLMKKAYARLDRSEETLLPEVP